MIRKATCIGLGQLCLASCVVAFDNCNLHLAFSTFTACSARKQSCSQYSCRLIECNFSLKTFSIRAFCRCACCNLQLCVVLSNSTLLCCVVTHNNHHCESPSACEEHKSYRRTSQAYRLACTRLNLLNVHCTISGTACCFKVLL